MSVEILAISDTHLGDPASLLNYDGERRALFSALQQFTGGTEPEPAAVDTVVLMGDIPDRCLANSAAIQRDTTAFMKMLLKAVRVTGKVVYLLGNHDHTLWRDLLRRQTPRKKYDISLPREPIPLDPANPAHQPLAKIFFNYPVGSLCRAPSGKPEAATLPVPFQVGNYFYHTKVGKRSYLFSHGQHWRSDVTHDGWMKLLERVDRLAIGHDIIAPDDPFAAADLKDLERRTYQFLDSLWSNDQDENMSPKAFEWLLLSNLTSIFESGRSGPRKHTLFQHDGQKLAAVSGATSRRVKGFRVEGDDDGPTQRLRKYVGRTFRQSGELMQIPLDDDLTLVYGDTHDSGYGMIEHIRDPQLTMRVYNTGAWVTHKHEYQPPGFVFAVKDGGEWMIEVAHDPASLEQAARDAQHLWDSISRPQRFLLEKIFKLKHWCPWE